MVLKAAFFQKSNICSETTVIGWKDPKCFNLTNYMILGRALSFSDPLRTNTKLKHQLPNGDYVYEYVNQVMSLI